MTYFVLAFALLFFVGHWLNWVFIRTKIPDILILILIGFIVGPVMKLMTAADFGALGPLFSTIALVVILYEGGLSLKFSELKESAWPSLKLSFISFLTVTAASFFIIFGLMLKDTTTALLTSLALGSTSSAVVIPLLKNLKISEKMKNVLSLESAFTDVLAIVLFLVVLDSITQQKFDARQILIAVGPNTVIAIVLGLLSGLIWSYFKGRYKKILPKAFAGEAWALLTYAFCEILGYNGAMAALFLGFFLANVKIFIPFAEGKLEPMRVEELSLLAEISFLLKTFFFIYLGILIQIQGVFVILLSLLLCAVILLTRYFSIKMVFSQRGQEERLDGPQTGFKDFLTAVLMGPRGLACSVLATLPLQKGFHDGLFIQNALFALIPFSILMTSLGLIAIENRGFQEKLSPIWKKP